jgi:hypothetical protein
MVRVYRTTTDKLDNALVQLQEEGHRIKLPVQWTGGRDWVIFFDDSLHIERDGTRA